MFGIAPEKIFGDPLAPLVPTYRKYSPTPAVHVKVTVEDTRVDPGSGLIITAPSPKAESGKKNIPVNAAQDCTTLRGRFFESLCQSIMNSINHLIYVGFAINYSLPRRSVALTAGSGRLNLP